MAFEPLLEFLNLYIIFTWENSKILKLEKDYEIYSKGNFRI